MIAPRFSLFDVYTDIAFPGGIHAAWFTDTWGRYNEALDRNALHEVVGWWAKLPVTGMQPVQEDRDRSLRDGAIAAHRGNYDVHQIAGSLTFRDDVSASDPYRGQPDARLEPIGTPIESGSINLISRTIIGVTCRRRERPSTATAAGSTAGMRMPQSNVF